MTNLIVIAIVVFVVGVGLIVRFNTPKWLEDLGSDASNSIALK